MDPDPGQVPRAHLDLQLHRVPDPPARHPRPLRRRRSKPVATLNGTLCASTRTIVAILETHQQADGSVRVPKALQPWLGGREVLEPVAHVSRGLDARGWSRSTSTAPILKWVEGGGMTHEEISPAVYAAVHRALDAGAHVVLASGRSPHGMTGVADLLDLYDEQRERLWIVASNGAVVFRYPPLEVVHEEKFDARPAVEAILDRHPTALVAVEERGVGYRVNSHFPEGELSGDMIVTEVADLIAAEVSRVIIRDPDATADDFVALAADLGLHGTNYVVGWTAWLDLAPVGVSKASGLEHVAERARPDRRRRARGRRRPQRPRDVRVGAPRRRDGPGDPGRPRRRRRRHRQRLRGRPGDRAGPLVPRDPPRRRHQRAAARLPLWTPDEAADIAAGRGREGWHRDYPRQDDRDAATHVPARRPVGAAAHRPGHDRARLDRLLRPARGRGRRRARGRGRLRPGRRRPAAGASRPRRCRRCWSRPTRPAYASGPASSPTNRPASGCSRSAASPSCAAPTRTASS